MNAVPRLPSNYTDLRTATTSSRATSSRRPGAALAILLAITIVVADAYAAVVNYQDVVQQDVDITTGLGGAMYMASDPGGTRLYVAGTADSALTVLDRASDGTLNLREVQLDDSAGGHADGLSGVSGIALDPTGAHVYTVALNDQALALFERTTQGLNQVAVYRDGTAGISGLQFPFRMVVSPDGAHVYLVTRNPAGTDAVLALEVLDEAGSLGFIEKYQDGVDGINGIDDASDLALSPDGRYLYVSGSHDSAVVVFAREADNASAHYGRLAWVATYRDGSNGIDGINGAGALALDPTGARLYVAGTGENAVAVFARDNATGDLSLLAAYRNGENGIAGLSNPSALAVSPDGGRVYVAGAMENALVILRREPDSGLLSYMETHRNGDDGITDGLDRVLALAVSPDGAHLYSASPLEKKVGIFAHASADLSLTVAPGAAAAGDPIDSRFIVTNNGPDTASNIRLTNLIPSGVTVTSISPPSGASCAPSPERVACYLGALAPGRMTEVGVRYDLAQANVVTITGSVYADQRDPDVSGNSDSEQMRINTAPVAVSDSVKVTPGTPVTIDVLANDSDPDGDALTITANDAASQYGGAITRNSNGVVYTPATGFTGIDTFSYTASDRLDDSTASVTVVVNTPPVARNDTATVTANSSAEILVLSNDTDADSHALQVTTVDATTAGGGSVTINGGNSVTYTPPADFTGSDSFSYSISDEVMDGASATVTITVQLRSGGVAVDPPDGDGTQTSHGGGGGMDTLCSLVLLLWMLVRRPLRAPLSGDRA